MKTLRKLPEPSEFGHFFFREPDDHAEMDTPAILRVQQDNRYEHMYFVTLGDGTVLWNRDTHYFQVFDTPQRALKAMNAALNRRVRRGLPGS